MSLIKRSACDVTTHHIRTKDVDPIYIKNFRHPYHLKKEILNQVKKFRKKLDALGKKKWGMVIDVRY